MDYKGLKAIPKIPTTEVVIMMVVLLLSVFWNLVYAVGIGLVIASLVFMKKMGDVTANDSDVKPLTKEKAWDDELNFPDTLKKEVFIKHVKGPLFFGSISEFQQLSKQIPTTALYAIIRMDRVPYIDQSGLYALEDVITELNTNKVQVLLVDIKKQPKGLMRGINLIPEIIPEEHIFKSFADCTTWIKSHVKGDF